MRRGTLKLETVIRKAKQVYKSRWFPFLALFGLMLLVHSGIYLNLNDDAVITRRILNEGGVLSVAKSFYETWSARFFIEVTYFTLLNLNDWVWRILDSGIIVLLAYSISRLFVTDNHRKNNWLITAVIMIYPWMMMSTAGWAATTANCLWPLALGLYSMTPWRKILDGGKLKWYRCIAPLAVLVYAANEEQMSALLLGFTIVIGAYYCITKKHIHLYFIAQLIIISALLVFIFTAPGNYVRMGKEVPYWFPDFYMYGTVEMLYKCFVSTCNNFILSPNLPVMLLCVCAAAAVFQKYREPLYRITAALPLFSVLVFGWLRPVIGTVLPALANMENNLATTINLKDRSNYLVLMLFLLIFGTIAVSLYLVFRNKKTAVCAMIILAAGICSKLIMAVSPTIYASGSRTEIYLYFAFLIIAFLILRELFEIGNKYYGVLQKGVFIISAFSYLNFLLSV